MRMKITTTGHEDRNPDRHGEAARPRQVREGEADVQAVDAGDQGWQGEENRQNSGRCPGSRAPLFLPPAHKGLFGEEPKAHAWAVAGLSARPIGCLSTILVHDISIEYRSHSPCLASSTTECGPEVMGDRRRG